MLVLKSFCLLFIFPLAFLDSQNNKGAKHLINDHYALYYILDVNFSNLPYKLDIPQNNLNCSDGFVADGSLTTCLRVATGYNEKCQESIQCSKFLSAGGSCINGVCVCKDGYHYLNGYCYKTKGLNENCDQDEDCFVNAEYASAKCVNGLCKCSDEFYQREYSTCRRKSKNFGDYCLLDFDCAAFNESAKCNTSNQCTLENSEIIFKSYDENSSIIDETGLVILQAIIGSNCTKPEDCQKSIPNSDCGLDKKCICQRAHFPLGNFTACVPEIGEECTADSELKVSYSECSNKKWTCKSDRVCLKNNQLCRKITIDIGGSCQYKESCQLFGPRSDCIDGKCVCNAASHWLESEHFCWISKTIGEVCESNYDCYTPEGSPQTYCAKNESFSSNQVCSCPKNTIPSSNNKYCVNIEPVLNNYCEENGDCKVSNSICEGNKCKCAENFYEFDGQCLTGLNAICETNNDCKLNHTKCSTKICVCEDTYVASPENECILKSKYHENCIYDVQCTSKISNSYCLFENTIFNFVKNGICECLPGYYLYDDNNCFKKKWLNDECTKKGECVAENSTAVCRNGKCSCDFNYVQEGRTCIKPNAGNMVDLPILLNLLLVLVATFM